MNFFLWQRDAGISLGSRRKVFRAAEVPLLADAQDLCVRMSAEQAAAAQRIEQAEKSARAAGYAAGLEAGSAVGRERVADRLVALAAELELERARLRDEAGQLALAIVRKLLGQFDTDATLARLATEAAREILPGPSIRLIVHPSHAEGVRAELARNRGELECEVVPDASVAPDTCRLETDHGTVDASLAAQLERVAALWGATAGLKAGVTA